MSKYPIHKEVGYLKYLTLPASPVVIPLINSVLTLLEKNVPVDKGIVEKHLLLNTYDDDTIKVTLYYPKDLPDHSPCLLYYYGSAYFMKRAPHHKKWAMTYAKEANCLVIVVDYRLAPQHPFPAPFLDCFLASEWVFQQAERLNIDPSRIAVGGDSSGGALASSVSMMRRDKHLKNFCFQFLIYPVTDAKMDSPSMKAFSDTPLWSSKLNEMMWSLYVQDPIQTDVKYAAPMEADTFSDLPEAFIEVCEFDPLRDEGLLYGDALMQAGVTVDLSFIPKMIHGYDINTKSSLAEASRHRRVAALIRGLEKKKARTE
ncbi:MAG: alpha/beta hydrolase [Alkalibacterium sp.]|nr:alpha/beta hydrolase [Alkalibacterium sp.]